MVPGNFILNWLHYTLNHIKVIIWNIDLTDKYGLSWSWQYGSWIYNYLCNQCLLPLKLWVQILLRRGVLDTTLCDKVCQWLATGPWFSPDSLVSSTNKTDCHDIIEILLKYEILCEWLVLNIIKIKCYSIFS